MARSARWAVKTLFGDDTPVLQLRHFRIPLSFLSFDYRSFDDDLHDNAEDLNKLVEKLEKKFEKREELMAERSRLIKAAKEDPEGGANVTGWFGMPKLPFFCFAKKRKAPPVEQPWRKYESVLRGKKGTQADDLLKGYDIVEVNGEEVEGKEKQDNGTTVLSRQSHTLQVRSGNERKQDNQHH